MSQPAGRHNRETTALLGVGSNEASDAGPPDQTVAAALDMLGRVVVARSALYRTPAFPPGSGPDFVNAAARLCTPESPEALLARLHRVEAAFGRVRAQRWGPRRLDLDLLDHGGAVLPDGATWRRWRRLSPPAQRRAAPARLILPHPRLAERAFVLVPLRDVASGWRHPVTGRTPAAMLAALPEAEIAAIRRI